MQTLTAALVANESLRTLSHLLLRLVDYASFHAVELC